MKKIDLHTHTTASDGIMTPSGLIDYAIGHGVEAMAITDHDTIDGLEEGMFYSNKKGFNLIPGIEFSVDFSKGSFHLVGLYIDYANSELINVIQRLNELRDNRAARMAEDLQRHNIKISLEDIERESDGGSIGRPHVARAMVRKGYAKNIKKVFEDYLVKGKPGYVKKEKISADDAIRIIKVSGGIPILAHPISLNFKEFPVFETMLDDLIGKGLEGIEAYASMHNQEQVDFFCRIGEREGLLITGGSDFHGDKDEVLGNYAPDRAIPYELLEKLEMYRRSGQGAL